MPDVKPAVDTGEDSGCGVKLYADACVACPGWCIGCGLRQEVLDVEAFGGRDRVHAPI